MGGQSQLASLGHHGCRTEAVSEPRQLPQIDGGLSTTPPKALAASNKQTDGCTAKASPAESVIRLKALAHALEVITREAGDINQPKAFDAKASYTRASGTDQPVCMARGERKSWVIASVPIVESAVDVTPRQGQGLAANPQLSSLSR